jgi:succinate dehydrogenase/fumarate reductase flavoprotein subunit
MRATPIFEIWWSQGGGVRRGPGFRWIEDAIRYVQEHRDEATHAIRLRGGPWHRWEDGSVFLRRVAGAVAPRTSH